jgi:hypothetical protein
MNNDHDDQDEKVGCYIKVQHGTETLNAVVSSVDSLLFVRTLYLKMTCTLEHKFVSTMLRLFTCVKSKDDASHEITQ